MHTFKDTEDRTWTLKLTIGAVKRVRSLVKVNLLDPLDHARQLSGKRHHPRPPLVTRLQIDPALLIDVIFVMIKPEADRLEVTDEQFGEAMGGDAAYDAYLAFMAEWRDFFRRLRRQTEEKAIEANLAMVKEDDERRAAMVPRVTETALKAVERERQKALEKIEALGRSGSATDSQESSEDSAPEISTD